MYILDELDAALDLSDTQHIGTLFRTPFRRAQFIVVSLKEGLFANSNVLFHTGFHDGTSIVERTGQRSDSSLYNHGEREREEGTAGGEAVTVVGCGGYDEVLHHETRAGRIPSVLVLSLYPWLVLVEIPTYIPVIWWGSSEIT
jgi:hypothetical protein